MKAPDYRASVISEQRAGVIPFIPAEPLVTLADRLRSARKKTGLTQEELAARAGLKRQSIIGGLESQHRTTSTYLPQIAAALGVNALWLATGEGPRDIEHALPARKAQLDSKLMLMASGVVDEWLDSQPTPMSPQGRMDIVCYLYEMFVGLNTNAAQLRVFLDRSSTAGVLRLP